MKRSEIKLRSLIREHIQKSLITEKFGSQEASYLNKKIKNDGGWGKSMLAKLSKQYEIAWDLIDGSAFGTSASGDGNVINFFFVNDSKKNYYAGNSWDTTIYRGLIGVTIGKKVAGYNHSRFSYSDNLSTGGKLSSRAGRQVAGLHNFKRYADVADEIITIDISKVKGTAADKIENRKLAKQGATALMKAKDVLAKNKARYDAALTKAREGMGLEEVQKMLEEAHAIYTSALSEDISTLKSGFYEDSWDGKFTNAQRLYENMVSKYKNFVEYADQAGKAKYDDNYYKKELPKIVRQMEDLLKDFKKKIETPRAGKKYPIIRER